jgi:Ca2+-binding RTX toxin-like protein
MAVISDFGWSGGEVLIVSAAATARVTLEADWVATGGSGNAGDANASTLVGSALADVLTGGLGADTLSGGAGNDPLIGDAGADRLTGGASDAIGDVIADFSAAQGDKVVLSQMDADLVTAGDQAFAFIGSTAFANTAGQLRFAVGVLRGDQDGYGLADFQIQMTGATSITATNFWL